MVPHIARYYTNRKDDDESPTTYLMGYPNEGPSKHHSWPNSWDNGLPSPTPTPSSMMSGSRHGSGPPDSSNPSESSSTPRLSEIQSPTLVPHNHWTSPPTGIPSSGFDEPSNPGPGKHGFNRTAMYAGAGIIPVIVIGIIIFFLVRRRKRQQQILAQTGSREMKMHDNRSYIVPPEYSAPPTAQPHYDTPPTVQPHYAAPPPTEPPPRQSPLTPQPVILGPIPAAGSSGMYLTGMDTSDGISVHDHTGLANPFASPHDHPGLRDPFADGDSTHDEPPPPYRPRSVANLSRDSSLRAPPASQSQMNLIEPPRGRSPFADPRDDDRVSVVSGRMLRRDGDDLSVVSDLSYQEDPVVPQSRV